MKKTVSCGTYCGDCAPTVVDPCPGQRDVTDACNPVCCNSGSQCPSGICGESNGYCTSGTSCSPAQCVPTTPCSSLGCGRTDSCGTYCGDVAISVNITYALETYGELINSFCYYTNVMANNTSEKIELSGKNVSASCIRTPYEIYKNYGQFNLLIIGKGEGKLELSVLIVSSANLTIKDSITHRLSREILSVR